MVSEWNCLLRTFGKQYYAYILWGAWLQAVGPLLIVAFAFAIVSLAGATARFAGLMTFFGGAVLMMVSLLEVTFYMSTLSGNPGTTGLTSLDLIHSVQHLYFIVGAPALFMPLGAVILGSHVLPRVFAYSAVGLGVAFVVLGVVFLQSLTLPVTVLAFPVVQVFWWLAAAILLFIRAGKRTQSPN